MILTAVGLSKPIANTCVCSVSGISANQPDNNYIWFTVSGEKETLVNGLKVPIKVSIGAPDSSEADSCTQNSDYTFSQCVQECLQSDCEYVSFDYTTGSCCFYANSAFGAFVINDKLFTEIKKDISGDDLMKVVPETYTESFNDCITITDGTSEKCAQMCEQDLECTASYMYTESSITKCCLVPAWHYGTAHKAMINPTQSTYLVFKTPNLSGNMNHG